MKASLLLPVRAEDRLLLIQEASDIFGVTTTTLRRWEKTEVFLPWDRTPGKRRRYRLSDVMYFKKQREIKKKKIDAEEFPIELKEDFGVKRNDRQHNVVIRETKVFQIIIENNMNRPMILIIVLGWMLSYVVKLISHLELDGLLIDANRLNSDYINVVERFKDDLEYKEIEVMQKKPINTAKRPLVHKSKWLFIRKNASQIFHQIVKASHNKAIDDEERNRAQEICDKITKPYSKLTSFLADFDPGTIKHDIANLLLNYNPEDYGYSRENWSVRLLSKISLKYLNTKSASRSSVGRLLKNINWYCAPKRKLHSPDPNYGKIIKKIAKTMNSLKKEDMLLFGDEFKFTSSKVQIKLEPKYVPKGLQNIFPKGNLRNDSLNNYTPASSIQVTGLYNPVTKMLGVKEIKNNTFEVFYNGLITLLDQFIKIKNGKIYLVLDNASYHGKMIIQYLLNQRYNNRVEIIWLPVYSPNNNPIEKIWDILLSSVDRECNNRKDLREALKLSMKNYSNSKPEKDSNHTLKCFTCGKKWEFRDDNKEKNDISIEKHFCFSTPLLNPYSIHVLTHSQEEIYLGQ